MHLKLRRVETLLIVLSFLLTWGCAGFFSKGVLQSINVTPPSPILGQSGTVQLTATGVNDDGSSDTLTNVSWSSSNTSIATVDGNGSVTGVSAGSATITAKSGSVSGTTTINVLSANLVTITVSPATAVVAPGQQQQFTATGNLANGQTTDITNMVTWSSSDKTVATITSTGAATAQTTGTATSVTISATSGQIVGTATLSLGL